MTVRVSRTLEFDVPVDRVWAFISDPAQRAKAISVVESYEVYDDNRATWHVSLPIPFVDSTIPVETNEIEREPPTRVKFVGKSKALRVTGEHMIEETETGSKLHNEFVVDGQIPGVERFFKSNLDTEIDNLERTMHEEMEVA
ncbi:MAG: SRPBCC family protein [Halopenitus sp.]